MRQPKIESPGPSPSTATSGEAGAKLDDVERQAGLPAEAEVRGGETDAAVEDDKGAHQQPTAQQCEVSASRLHRSSLWLPLVETFFRSLVPAFIASLFIGPGNVLFFFGFFVLLPSAIFHSLRYFTLRYRVSDTEIVLQSGLIFRRERRIPVDRVQEIELHQGIVHRLLDLAKLTVTTAGSDAQEASLNVLSMAAAEALKETITHQSRPTTDQLDEEAAREAESADCICQLSLKDLILGGVTSRLVASLGAVVAAIVYFQFFLGIGGRWVGNVEREVEGEVERHLPAGAPFDFFEQLESKVPDLGPLNFVVDLVFNDTMSKSISLVLFGLVASVATYVVRYHGFRLIRSGDLLTMSHGLLTFRRGSLSRDRIQALKLEEGLLRRWLGLATIHVDSAGDRNQIDDGKKRDVLVPVAPKQKAQGIASQVMPGLQSMEPAWQRISRRAIMRGSKKGWLLVLLVMLQTYLAAGWFFLLWLPALPLVYFLNYQWYRHTGYWLDEYHFLSRKGWLNRATVCLPIKNVQNVSVRQSLFDRRLGLATLAIDTAGQSNTGGGPVIRHVPVQEARQLQQVLTDRVAESEFNW